MLSKISLIYKEHKKELLGLIIFLAIFVTVSIVFQRIGAPNIKNFISGLGIWAPIFFIIIMASSIVFVPFEGSFLMLASGPLFGFWWAILYTTLAGIIGSSANFWISRIFGEKIMRKLVGEKGIAVVDRVTEKVNKHPILLAPIMASTAFDLVGYAAGLTKIKYSKFLVAVLISSIVNVPIYVGVGEQVFNNPYPLFLVIIILSILAGVYFAIHSLRKKYLKSQN